MLQRMFKKREKGYKAMGYKKQEIYEQNNDISNLKKHVFRLGSKNQI